MVEKLTGYRNELTNKINELKRSQQEIQELNESLENKVEERTKELNITNRELTEKNEQLRELDKLKSNFFANISHEVRTPLMLIISPLEELLSGKYGKLTDEQIEFVESMQRNASRLLRLINNILDFSKIEAGKMTLNVEKVDIVELINFIISSAEIPARSKNIQISLDNKLINNIIYFDK
jgi:signal transduction histidine kinase